MSIKQKLATAVIIFVGITGVYLIITSGRIQLDPYGVVLAVIVGGFALYFYLPNLRSQ